MAHVTIASKMFFACDELCWKLLKQLLVLSEKIGMSTNLKFMIFLSFFSLLNLITLFISPPLFLFRKEPAYHGLGKAIQYKE